MLATFKAAVIAFFMSPMLNAGLPFAMLGAALWRGGWRERALGLLGAVTWLYGYFFQLPWVAATHTQRGVRDLMADLIGLAVCLVALRGARRYWVVLAAGLSLLSTALDLLFLLQPNMWAKAIVRGNLLISYVLDVVVIWASLTNRRGAPADAAPRELVRG